MTTMEHREAWERRIATLGLVLVTVMALLGLGKAIGRPKGRVVGRGYEHLPIVLYVLVAAAEVTAVVRLWRPISLRLSRPSSESGGVTMRDGFPPASRLPKAGPGRRTAEDREERASFRSQSTVLHAFARRLGLVTPRLLAPVPIHRGDAATSSSVASRTKALTRAM